MSNIFFHAFPNAHGNYKLKISNSQVGSEHAKCYSEHNSECIPFHVNMHVNCLSLFVWKDWINFWGEWKWAYIFLIGRKRTNQNACAHAWLACHGPNPSNQKNPNVPYWQTCHSEWFPVRIHTTTSYIKSYTYLGCSFRWSLLFCCVLLVFLPKREKENWCTADFFSRSSRGQIWKQCNVYNT